MWKTQWAKCKAGATCGKPNGLTKAEATCGKPNGLNARQGISSSEEAAVCASQMPIGLAKFVWPFPQSGFVDAPKFLVTSCISDDSCETCTAVTSQ